MANNPYVNKVQLANGTTLIDLSTDTVVASDVAQGKYFHLPTGERVQGTATGGGEIVITDEPNATGTTAVVTGDEISLITKTINQNGTYSASTDGADGYSSVTVNVSGGGTPSVTQHTIYFEFTDLTSTTIPVYYDDIFIGSAITATTPTTYGGKRVTLAQLDGSTWYDASATWETIWDNNTNYFHDGEVDEAGHYPYCWIAQLADVDMQAGTEWRVTFDNDIYYLTAVYSDADNGVIIGNNIFYGGSGTGYDDLPFSFGPTPWNAWSGSLNARNIDSVHYVKIERMVTS